jgi:hypothetical protein
MKPLIREMVSIGYRVTLYRVPLGEDHAGKWACEITAGADRKIPGIDAWPVAAHAAAWSATAHGDNMETAVRRAYAEWVSHHYGMGGSD